MSTGGWESIPLTDGRYQVFLNPATTTSTASNTFTTSSSAEVRVPTRKDNTIYCPCWVHEKKIMPTDKNGNCRRCGCKHIVSIDGSILFGRAPIGAIKAAGLIPSPAYSIIETDDGDKSAVVFVERGPVTLEEQYVGDIDPDDEDDGWDDEDEEDEDDE